MSVTAVVRIALPLLVLLGASGKGVAGHAVRTADQTDDIAAIVRAVTTRRAGCAAIISGYLGRIRTRDSALQSVVAINPAALAEARRIDRRLRQKRHAMPLACVPVLIKDNIDVAGLPTTAGSVALAANMAVRDADAVARLKAAGAIIVAKTNMSEFALNYRGRSSIRGQTYSPFSEAESAGGSSSGNAAALASGLGVIALGTDTSGSLRVPAALTGTTGLRPTFGSMPMGGVLPLSPSQDVIGPMCRKAEDCSRMLTVLKSEDGPRRKAGLHGLKVGVLREFMSPDPRTEQAVARALEALARAGVAVSDTHLRDGFVLTGRDAPLGQTATFASRSAFDLADVMDRYLPMRRDVPANSRALLERLITLGIEGRTDKSVIDDVRKFVANRDGAEGDPRTYVNGPFRDRFVAERIGEALRCGKQCPEVLVYPSVQRLAAPADKGPDTAGTHRLAAYSGYPAVALTVGWADTASGPRPVSLELMGPPGSDERLLEIAAAWQAELQKR